MKDLIVISSPDEDFSLSARHILDEAGFDARIATSMKNTLALIGSERTAAVLIDGRMFGAVTMCEMLKQDPSTSRIKIIALVSASSNHRYTDFLNARVDEVFMRPVDPRMYLRSLTRLLSFDGVFPDRSNGRDETLSCGGIDLDLRQQRVWYGGSELRLSPVELRLLHLLVRDPGRAFTRGELISGAWPPRIFVEPKTVNVHIARLRRSLKAVHAPEIIRTVRGTGYAFTFDGDPSSRAHRGNE